MAHSFGGKLNGETLGVLQFFVENNLIKKSRVAKLIEAETKKIESAETLSQENAALKAKIAKLETTPKAKPGRPTTKIVTRSLNDTERAILAVVASKPTVSRAQVVTRLGDAGIGVVAWNVARKSLLGAGLIEQVDARKRFATYKVTKAGEAAL